MPVNNIFIAGFEKCGTTALSDWMLTNGLVEDRVPGVKEPYLYANDQPHAMKTRTSALPLLDASVGYASDPTAIQRLPEHGTRIVLCLRNQFERLWSSYRMMNVVGIEDLQVEGYFSQANAARNRQRGAMKSAAVVGFYQDVYRKYFPRRSHHTVERYVTEELARLSAQNFLERVEYELGFYLSRRQLPFLSILAGCFFYYPLRTLLEKFQPSDIAVVSVDKLKNTGLRQRFVEGVFEKTGATSEVPLIFSGEKIELDEAKPDFNHPSFDLLRSVFRYDLQQACPLIDTTLFGDSLVDTQGLGLYGVKP